MIRPQRKLAALAAAKPPAKGPAKVQMRKCCASQRGQKVPHAADCGANVKKPQRPSLFMEKSRLPDGSMFQAIYDDSRKMWSGQLLLIDTPKNDLVERQIKAECSGVMGLLRKLDGLYREGLGAEGKS